jgi:hypothetical protein
MKKILLLAAAGALALALATPGATYAQPAPQPASPAAGEPAVSAASAYGYYIWVKDGRVHLRTTDPGGAPSEYSGRITTDGDINGVQLVRPEAGDRAIVSRGAIEFHFQTWNVVDGLDFGISGADRVTFRLFRNGHLINTEHIFLGAGGHHPPGNPFVVLIR